MDEKKMSTKIKNKSSTESTLNKYVPLTKWIMNYDKEKCISDIIAGITVGITMIPQSIAYAALANLSPKFGLNSAFVGCFTYAIFGTIKEVFIGPSSLMAILASSYTNNLNLEFIVFLTFISGCVELMMAVLKLGFLVDYISEPVVSGFVSAVAIIIFVSQLKDLVGVKFKTGGVVNNIRSLISNFDNIRYYDFVLGIACIATLYALRNLKDVKIKQTNGKSKCISTKKIIWFISISRNAIVVFTCMFVSMAFTKFVGTVPFVLTSNIHSGVPDFNIPPLSTSVGNTTYTFTDMLSQVGFGSLVVPMVAVLESIAIGRSFSKGKTIDATQEMIAIGFGNVIGSCFGAMPTCGALTRSAVANASNVQSPIASFYAALVVLLAVTFLSPYFHLIPRATLAAVLICALIYLIDWEILKPLWKTSKKDFFIMIITFFICIIFGIEVGLISGIVISSLHLIYLWSSPNFKLEIHSLGNDRKYVLLKIDKGLYYPCIDQLRNVVISESQRADDEIAAVVIDCSHFSGVDYTAIKNLSLLIKEVNESNRKLILLRPNENLVDLCKDVGNCQTLIHFDSETELENNLCVESTNRSKRESLVNEYLNENESYKIEIGKEMKPLLSFKTVENEKTTLATSDHQ